nr:MAG TPA: hypothetical protein [Caudoviricetes sp.]
MIIIKYKMNFKYFFISFYIHSNYIQKYISLSFSITFNYYHSNIMFHFNHHRRVYSSIRSSMSTARREPICSQEHPVSVRGVMFRQDGYVLKERVRVEKPHFGVERRS